MKFNKPVTPIDCPPNYTLVMFDLIDSETNEVVRSVAPSARAARGRVDYKVTVRPTRVKELVDQFGHADAHHLLKEHGQTWMTKDGLIYFPKED